MKMVTFVILLQLLQMVSRQEVEMWESHYSRVVSSAESTWTGKVIQGTTKQTLDANTAGCPSAKNPEGEIYLAQMSI
jgi:hypothetical protein